MVGQSLNSFASFSLISFKTTLFSSMMPIRKPRNILCQWLNSWKGRGLFYRASCINGNRLSSCMSWRNTSKKVVLSTCVGAATIRWQINNKQASLKKQKAPICRRSFFYIVRCEWNLNNSTLASCGFTCNNSSRCYV